MFVGGSFPTSFRPSQTEGAERGGKLPDIKPGGFYGVWNFFKLPFSLFAFIRVRARGLRVRGNTCLTYFFFTKGGAKQIAQRNGIHAQTIRYFALVDVSHQFNRSEFDVGIEGIFSGLNMGKINGARLRRL
jgi:hypothetical protein